MLPPTSDALGDDDAQPYFLWWTSATVGDLRRHLSPNRAERAYWMGALLRDANSRDVWRYVTPREIRELWPELVRHLGRSRAMWSWLIDAPQVPWPPPEASREG